MTTNDNPIEALRARVAVLPPGPHEVLTVDYAITPPEQTIGEVPTLHSLDDGDRWWMSRPTAETVAAVLNVMPELLAVVEAMRAIRDGDWWEVRHKDVQRGANALDALNAKIREVLR